MRKKNYHHAAKQAYIALGHAIITAALQELESTPIEGFNQKALDDILDLKEKGFVVVSF